MLEDLSKEEQKELAISITSDIASLLLSDDEHYELITLVNTCLSEKKNLPLIEFLLGIPSLEEYLKEEIGKLEGYMQEDNDEQAMEEDK